MKISLPAIRKTAGISLLLYTLLFYLLIILLPEEKILTSSILGFGGEVISLFIIIFSLNQQTKEQKTTWKIFALGIAIYLIGDSLWFVYESIFKQRVPFPSTCDIFYLLSSVCYFIALIFYIRKENLYNIIRTGFDIMITMVAATTIIWKYILLPIAVDLTLTSTQKFISLAYPIMDIGYLAGIFSLFFLFGAKSKINKATLLLSTAFMILFITDQIYSVLANYEYISGSLLDPLWPIACWVLALASLWPNENKIINTNVIHSPGIPNMLWKYFRFLLPYISACFIILLVSYQYIAKDPLVAGSVIVVLLIILRQIFTLIENEKLIKLIQQTNKSLEENKLALEKQNFKLQQLNYLKEHEANTDFLTGLYNRRYIDETLNMLQTEKERNEQLAISVLLIDIDYFKQINDQKGHDMGDVVLKQIAEIIKDNIRSTDIAGRFGGDEFIVILPNGDFSIAKTIAARFIQKTSVINLTENGMPLEVTLSIGCTQWTKGSDINRVIAEADKALYKAKASGRNQFQQYDNKSL